MKASELKAKLLAVLDDVSRTGEGVRISKRGRLVAVLMPPLETGPRFPQDLLAGSVEIQGDVVSPVLDDEEWEAARSPKRARRSRR